MKNLFLKVAFILILAFNLFFASWYVLHGDINFYSDVGRDFLILKEIDQKKIILIGPRASGNLFHGPAWPYFNYPFYALGKGDPVVVGWGWVFYTSVFAISCYLIAKKLFNKETGYLFSLMASLYGAFHARDMINPNGALFFIPLFFYFFVRYFETARPKYLIANLLTGMWLVQMELALGIPLVILSVVAFSYKLFKTRNFKYFAFFAIIPMGLINFVIFDLRHNFLITNKALEFISPKANGQVFNYVHEIGNRVYLAFFGVEILRSDIFYLNFFLLLGILLMIFIQYKDKKYRLAYLSFLYIYFGYFVLSLIDKGPLLYFYQFPFFPLVFLIFCSFVTSRYKYIFLAVFGFVLIMNLKSAVLDMYNSKDVIGKRIYSWKFLSEMVDKVYTGKENTLGIFVYGPDVYAYGEKYAVLYKAQISSKKTEYHKKSQVTYVIAEPPASNNPYMFENWWIENKVNIKSKPVSITKFENGYKIYKYQLTDEEIKIAPVSDIDYGIQFR